MRISTGVADGWRTIQITEAEPDQRAALDELGHPADVVRRYPNWSVRVPPLELQRRVEIQRQRLDRVAAIDAFTRGRRDGSRR